ncbi:3-hydroxyisobutyryl-CoA hydrolase 1-like isoform X2 [Aristolochia californica]|uniref:3-hydroxyisobutyryl-CoA hydrolase 1-like isoform X2 n=1 Tax=Aristolochia californica TaxID=171875 RepID=UPI0035DC0274
MASSQHSNGAVDQVLVEEKSFARILTLNRPRQLNALSFEMISQLLDLFIAYEDDPSVKLVILKGKGRAFCAGGDVAAVVRVSIEGHWNLAADFFGKEFTLNYILSTCKKPQVSFLNGIVMGGGAGVSIHGRFRVVTENSVFSMPETALGLFPDIGASYFLSRLPGFFGEYCGLTGARLDGAEMLACGLATHFVSSERLPLLEKALTKVDVMDPAVISAIIDQFSEQVPLKEKSAYHRMEIIDKCFSKRTVEEILSALEQEAAKSTDVWLAATIESMRKASPTSLKISLRSIREGRLQSIDQCLIREYRMVCHILRRDVNKDFFEGCRAILLDKDKNPKWEPANLEMISEEMVDKFFLKVDDEDWTDLKLPLKPYSVTSTAASKL